MAKGAPWLCPCMCVYQVTYDLQLKQEYDIIKELHSLLLFVLSTRVGDASA